MPLTPGQRINMIRESATLLDKQDYPGIDLVLRQHGLPTSDFAADTKSAYVMEMIDRATDVELTTLHQYLTDEAGGGQPDQSPWSCNRLRLFCSHLATHKALVGEVGDQLSRWGVEPFVAHDAIEPSKEWALVIESALADCDAMVVFLHPGFAESKWCDQEVGWALGRKRPTLPLNYGIHPYGFLGKYQDTPCSGKPAYAVASLIMDWLTKVPTLQGRLAPGLVDAFVNSRSWNFTRAVIPFLERMDSVDDEDLTRMEVAAKDNVDVREVGLGEETGPEWVQRFVAARRTATSEPSFEFSDEPPF